MTAHKHAALMLQYAQDALETETPWERWQVRGSMYEMWDSLENHGPLWHPDWEYRRKPRMTTYTVTMPEPLRRAPKDGDGYYVPCQLAPALWGSFEWYNGDLDKLYLKRGLCFATEEDAIAAAKAMMPLKWGGIMSNKPEALRLAEHLKRFRSFPDEQDAAAELRRLHEVNQELIEALDSALKLIELVMPIEGDVTRKARAAIAKATGEQT